MRCDETQQSLLDLGLTGQDRARATEALAHLRSCPLCQSVADEYELLHERLAGDMPEVMPAGGWDAFQTRMRVVLTRPRWVRWRPLAAVAAALAVVGAVAFQVGRATISDRIDSGRQHVVIAAPSDASLGSAGSLSSGDVERRVRAFSAISDSFDHRTRWVLDSESASDVGLADVPLLTSEKLLVLRLTMMHGGNLASTADLVIVPGQTAAMSVPLARGGKLRYQVSTSSRQPNQLSLWVEVQERAGGPTMAALATNVQFQSKGQVRAGPLVTSGGAYDLRLNMAQASAPRSIP